MDVEITARHMDFTDAMDRHIRQHVERLPAFSDMVRHMTVTLDSSSGSLQVEILARLRRAELVAEARGHDMYRSIDEAFAKLERRLVRHHDKLVKGRARGARWAAESEEEPE